MFELNAFAGLVVSILCTSTAYIILIESSQTEDGQFKYSFVLVLLLTSLVKLVLSASALYYDTYVNNPEAQAFDLPLSENNIDGGRHFRQDWRNRSTKKDLMYASASATLYAINDIFVFIVMSYFESSSYTVLVTGKIAVVAFLSRVVLHRFMTKTQYIACILLTVGIITFQSNFCPELEKHKHRGNAMEGYSVVLFSEMVGGVAGILNEYILKEQSRDNLPIHYANSLLYFISLCIYIPVLLLWEHDNMGNVFHDIQYNIIVPMIIVNACRGISISFIYKQSTNMTKIFIVIPGIILTWIVSAIYLDFNFTVQAFLSIIVIFCALYLYMSEEEGKGEEEEGIDGGNEAIGLDNRHDGYSDSGMGKERDDRDVNSTATDGSPMRLSIDDEGKDCSSPAAADVTIHAFESKGHSKDINDGHSTHTVSSGSTFTTASITASSSSSALAKPSSSSASANGGKKYATLLNDPEFGLNDDNESLSDYVEPEKHTLEMTMVMGTP